LRKEKVIPPLPYPIRKGEARNGGKPKQEQHNFYRSLTQAHYLQIIYFEVSCHQVLFLLLLYIYGKKVEMLQKICFFVELIEKNDTIIDLLVPLIIYLNTILSYIGLVICIFSFFAKIHFLFSFDVSNRYYRKKNRKCCIFLEKMNDYIISFYTFAVFYVTKNNCEDNILMVCCVYIIIIKIRFNG